MCLGFGQGERPGVEEGDPAAQHGAVVPVPGAQPPAGARAVAVHLDQSGQACGVPVGADLLGGEPEVGGRAVGGGGGEGGLAVGGGGVTAGAQGVVRPAGDADRAGQPGAGHFGQLGGRGCALRRPGCGAARAPLVHSCGGGGQGSRSDESEPGVARDTGRHRSSLPVDGPKTQTECHGGRQGWPTHRVPQAVGRRVSANRTVTTGTSPAVPGAPGAPRRTPSHQRGQEAP